MGVDKSFPHLPTLYCEKKGMHIMADSRKENRRNLVNTAIWSTALLLVLAVGLLIFMSSAQRKTKNKDKTDGTSHITESENVSENAVTDALNPSKGDKINAGEGSGKVSEEVSAGLEQNPNDVPASSYPHGEDLTYLMPINGSLIKDYTHDVAVYSLTMNDYRIHNGIDIAAPVGTKVMACAQGVIERVWEDPFLGCSIEINHGGDMRSLYHGLSPDLPKGIEAGVTVLAGDVIAGVGETMAIEQADSDHLHFAMTKGGVYVDPLDYISNFNGSIVSDYEE